MTEFIKKFPGVVILAFALMMGVVTWSLRQGMDEFKEGISELVKAQKETSCAVTSLTMKVERWITMTGVLTEDVDDLAQLFHEQSAVVSELEKKVIKLEM